MGVPEPVPETEAVLVPFSLRRPFKCREVSLSKRAEHEQFRSDQLNEGNPHDNSESR